jgi:hypothetical protein
MIDEEDSPVEPDTPRRARQQFVNDWLTTRAWRRMCLALDDAVDPLLDQVVAHALSAAEALADTDDAHFLVGLAHEAETGAWYEVLTHVLHALRVCADPLVRERDHDGELCDYIRRLVPAAPGDFEKIGQLGGKTPPRTPYARTAHACWVDEG